MIVGRNEFDVNVRQVVQTHDPVVIEIVLLDDAVPNADFLAQSQTKTENDAALELRNDIVGLRRDAAVDDAPEIVHFYLTGRVVDRNLRDAAHQRIVVNDEGAAQGRVVTFAVPVSHFRDALQNLLSARRDLQQVQPELPGIAAQLVSHLVEKYISTK